jgi:hypothetical protein
VRAGLQLGDGERGKVTWRACGARRSGLERKVGVRGRPGESPLRRRLLCFSKAEGERLGMTTGVSSSASTGEDTVVLWCDAAWAVAGLAVTERREAASVETREERWASSWAGYAALREIRDWLDRLKASGPAAVAAERGGCASLGWVGRLAMRLAGTAAGGDRPAQVRRPAWVLGQKRFLLFCLFGKAFLFYFFSFTN